jgi:hypothetical protein
MHFEAVRGWLDELGELQEFEYADGQIDDEPKIRKFDARVAIVPAEEMYKALDKFAWTQNYSMAPTLRFLRQAMDKGALTDWAVVVPELRKIRRRDLAGNDVQLLKRARRDRGGFSGSSFRQRHSIEHIAGNPHKLGGPNAETLTTPTRGAMLLTFAADPGGSDASLRDPERLADPIDTSDIATLFSLAAPYRSAPRGRIGFRVLDKSKGDVAIIDSSK